MLQPHKWPLVCFPGVNTARLKRALCQNICKHVNGFASIAELMGGTEHRVLEEDNAWHLHLYLIVKPYTILHKHVMPSHITPGHWLQSVTPITLPSWVSLG